MRSGDLLVVSCHPLCPPMPAWPLDRHQLGAASRILLPAARQNRHVWVHMIDEGCPCLLQSMHGRAQQPFPAHYKNLMRGRKSDAFRNLMHWTDFLSMSCCHHLQDTTDQSPSCPSSVLPFHWHCCCCWLAQGLLLRLATHLHWLRERPPAVHRYCLSWASRPEVAGCCMLRRTWCQAH